MYYILKIILLYLKKMLLICELENIICIKKEASKHKLIFLN